MPDGSLWVVRPVGKGATNYIASNATEEGREKNRRVEIKVPEKNSGQG